MRVQKEHAVELMQELKAKIVLVMTLDEGGDAINVWNLKDASTADAVSALASSLVGLYKIQFGDSKEISRENFQILFDVAFRLAFHQEFPDEVFKDVDKDDGKTTEAD